VGVVATGADGGVDLAAHAEITSADASTTHIRIRPRMTLCSRKYLASKLPPQK
jgi:hypothetical protein